MEELFYVVVLDNNDEVIYLVGDYLEEEATELTRHFNGLLGGLGLARNENNENDYLAVAHLTVIE